MKLKEFLRKRLKQNVEKGPKSDVVISSRIRLARNLNSKIFPWRANSTILESIWKNIKDILKKQKELANGEVFYLPNLNTLDRQLLVERHLISHEHAKNNGPRGAVVSNDEKISVMVNEEDHLRLASITHGLDLASASKSIDSLDDKLSQELGYAFSDNWGFLTACPTNAGTGMRASCLVHLPGLMMTDKIEPMLAELSKLGVAVRGFYGEGTQVIGDIFQITNASTLGRSESEILQTIERVVNGIISYEKTSRQELLEGKKRIVTMDKIFRAAATLMSAHTIDYKETMILISRARLGISLGMGIPWKEEILNSLMIITQPAHLQELMGKNLNSEDRDIIRAKIIRDKLNKPQSKQ
ncbi:MAG: protein arginine kinase [Endomicrobiales bacterium]|nr:protein arginine kinase [Endomicrobiales bacterium]